MFIEYRTEKRTGVTYARIQREKTTSKELWKGGC